MYNATEQFADFNKVNVANATKLAALSMQSAEKLFKLNLNAAKIALQQSVESAQTFERALDQLQRAAVLIVLIVTFILLAHARLDIGQLLDGAYRHLSVAVFGLDRVEVSRPRPGEFAEVRPHARQRRL